MKSTEATRQFFFSEDGTAAVEYAVLLGGILLAIIVGVSTAGGGVGNWWGNIRNKILSY
ncbi:MAG: Flp family type IVb pilin [Planctomycetota bacterium]